MKMMMKADVPYNSEDEDDDRLLLLLLLLLMMMIMPWDCIDRYEDWHPMSSRSQVVYSWVVQSTVSPVLYCTMMMMMMIYCMMMMIYCMQFDEELALYCLTTHSCVCMCVCMYECRQQDVRFCSCCCCCYAASGTRQQQQQQRVD